MTLTIIIVSYNTSASTARCVDCVRRHVQSTHEVIVVDNASADDTVAVLRRKFPEITIIENATNVGFAAANNQAIRMARGEYVLLLNPDTAVTAGSIDRIIEHMDTHPAVGIAAGTIQQMNGRDCIMETWFPGPVQYVVGPLVKRWRNAAVTGEVDFASGACLMIRRACLEQVGLLDERIFMYAEDADWCYRARELGWSIHVVPGASIPHIGGESGQSDFTARVYNGRQGKLFFADKHYGLASRIAFRIILAAEAACKLLIDASCYPFRPVGRKHFYRQRMLGYSLLLVHLPFPARFRIPSRVGAAAHPCETLPAAGSVAVR